MLCVFHWLYRKRLSFSGSSTPGAADRISSRALSSVGRSVCLWVMKGSRVGQNAFGATIRNRFEAAVVVAARVSETPKKRSNPQKTGFRIPVNWRRISRGSKVGDKDG